MCLRAQPREGMLHTLTKSMGLLWNPLLKPPRWLTASELLVAMGFPVEVEVAEFMQTTCPFTRGIPETAASRSRTRTTMRQEAGNSIHVNVAGAILMTTWFMYVAKVLLHSPLREPNKRNAGQTAFMEAFDSLFNSKRRRS